MYPVAVSGRRFVARTAEPSETWLTLVLGYSRWVISRPDGDDRPASAAANGSSQEAAANTSPPDAGGRSRRRRAAKSISRQIDAMNNSAGAVERVRRARALLPGDPAFGDPLSTTGPGSARAVARFADRLVGDRESVGHEMGLAALQVWQAMLEQVGRGKGTHEVTVMFTDLVAFSSWSLAAGDEATLELLREVAKAIEPPIQDRGGQVVKRLGDGVMAVFSSADRAVQAAVAARSNLAEVEVEGFKPLMRVGLHTGTPRQIGGDWLGVDVTIAARVMEAGGNGNTMLSATTLQALHPDTLDKLGCSVKPYRRSFFASPLSGVPEDLRIFTLML